MKQITTRHVLECAKIQMVSKQKLWELCPEQSCTFPSVGISEWKAALEAVTDFRLCFLMIAISVALQVSTEYV